MVLLKENNQRTADRVGASLQTLKYFADMIEESAFKIPRSPPQTHGNTWILIVLASQDLALPAVQKSSLGPTVTASAPPDAAPCAERYVFKLNSLPRPPRFLLSSRLVLMFAACTLSSRSQRTQSVTHTQLEVYLATSTSVPSAYRQSCKSNQRMYLWFCLTTLLLLLIQVPQYSFTLSFQHPSHWTLYCTRRR